MLEINPGAFPADIYSLIIEISELSSFFMLELNPAAFACSYIFFADRALSHTVITGHMLVIKTYYIKYIHAIPGQLLPGWFWFEKVPD